MMMITINAFLEYDWILLSFGGILCISAIVLLRRRKCSDFPPGPQGIPGLGYAPFLRGNGAETLRKLKSTYGPVMSVQLGMQDWVVLNDFDTINECLGCQGDRFSGRPMSQILDMVTWRKGVMFIDYGDTWKQLRKFGSKTLRGFGVGRKGMEENIIEETPYLINELMKETQNPGIKFMYATSNIICRLVFGSRLDYGDRTFLDLTRILREFFSDNSDSKIFGVLNVAPILRHFPVFKGVLRRMLKLRDDILGILRDVVTEHEATFQKEDLRDFIDAFLAEMKQRGPNDERFNEEQLLQYTRDLFAAGAGTTSSTLTWAVLALVNYPECQTKIAEEIRKTIGDSGLPSMKHQESMPYTCAFIHELMRHRTVVPSGLMRKTNERAFINGYTIPKDTPVIANIWSVHHDPELFQNPETFMPERFLNADGTFVKSNYVIPFSVGPRHCLGEQLARKEIFIFLTGIIQKLKIVPDPANPPPPLSDGGLIFLTTYEPPIFQVAFEKR